MIDTVRVKIQASRNVHYHKEVTMSKKEFKEIEDALDDENDALASDLVEGWFEEQDIIDADEMESVDATLIKPATEPQP